MANVNLTGLIIILNMTGLKTPIKIQRLSDLVKKDQTMLPTRDVP